MTTLATRNTTTVSVTGRASAKVEDRSHNEPAQLVRFEHWLDSYIAGLSPIARMATEGAILTACVALVIVTAVLFLSTPGA